MPHVLQDERNCVNPGFLRLDNLTAYIRGDSKYYKPFPGPDWFTPSRMAEIHKRMAKVWTFMVAKVGTRDTETAMEIEKYYLHLLSRYQFLPFGGEIGPDPQRVSKHHKAVVRARSIRDWHKLLDFLSDRMFYWARQHRVNIAQVEAMLRIWLLIRYYHRNRTEIGSLHHANDMRHSRINGQGRKPGSRSSNRRGPRSQRCGSAVSKGRGAAEEPSSVR